MGIHKMVDESGKPIKFNSAVDALNYMSSLGWELVTAFETGTNGNNVGYHFLMTKTLEEGDNINDDITTKKEYDNNNNNE